MTRIFGNIFGNICVICCIPVVLLVVGCAGSDINPADVRVIRTDCAEYPPQTVYDRPVYVEKQTDKPEYRKSLGYIRFIEELKGTIKLYEAQVNAFNRTLSRLSSDPTDTGVHLPSD